MIETIGTFFLFFILGQSYYPLELLGGILEAQYIANIYLGTPPQQFKVSIDTGSGRLAVNCRGCNNCQTHPNPPYDPIKSSSSFPLNCDTPQYCSNCHQAQLEDSCNHTTNYYDNSFLSGSVFKDYVSLYFDGLTGSQSILTCINHMSPQFASDHLIDGIWGLAKNDFDHENNLYRSDQFVSEISAQAGTSRMMSICLSYEGGLMIFGGSDSTKHTKPAIIVNYDTPESDAISKSVGRMKIGQTVIHENAGQVMHDLIIDSGSTTSVLDTYTFNTIKTVLMTLCESMGQDCLIYSQNKQQFCLDLSTPDLLNTFPDISIVMNGQEVLWPAIGYLLLADRNYPSYFCFGSLISQTGDSCVFGADFMIGKDIVFKEQTIEIYPDSFCGGQSFEELTQNLVAGSSQITRKSGMSKSVLILLLVCIPTFIILVVFVLLYFRNLKKKNLLRQEVKIEGERVIEMVPPTDARMGQETDDIKV